MSEGTGQAHSGRPGHPDSTVASPSASPGKRRGGGLAEGTKQSLIAASAVVLAALIAGLFAIFGAAEPDRPGTGAGTPGPPGTALEATSPSAVTSAAEPPVGQAASRSPAAGQTPRVPMNLEIQPRAVRVGESITVKGTGFLPNSEVNLSLGVGPKEQRNVMAGPDGTFMTQFVIDESYCCATSYLVAINGRGRSVLQTVRIVEQ